MDQAITRFAELGIPRGGEMPGDAQRRAQAEFPAVLAGSPLRPWSPSAVSNAGRVLVIGVATWSRYDLRLLDLVNDHLAQCGSAVHVFDIDTISAADEMERRAPGQGTPHHPPVVALWQDGRFVESACGFAGRHLVYRALEIEPGSAEKFVLKARIPSPA